MRLPSNTNWDVLICCCSRSAEDVVGDEARLLTGEWATECVRVEVVAAVGDKGTLLSRASPFHCYYQHQRHVPSPSGREIVPLAIIMERGHGTTSAAGASASTTCP